MSNGSAIFKVIASLVWGIVFLGSIHANAGTRYVSHGGSDGIGSLRVAIEEALDGDVIRIDGSLGICLTNQISISPSRFTNRGLTIDGYGASISGQKKCRLFEIGNANKIIIRNVVILDGYQEGNGGAIANYGDLLVEHSTICDNHAYSYGRGGGIYNTGDLKLNDVLMARNMATHDHLSQSYVSPSDRGAGGGIFNHGGNVSFDNSCATQNYAQQSACWLFSSDGRISVNNSRFESQNGILGSLTNRNLGVVARVMKGNVVIRGCTFANNDTTQYNQYKTTLFDCSGHCSISGEDAYQQTNNVNVGVYDSTFISNKVYGYRWVIPDGGLVSGYRLTISDCMFCDNVIHGYDGDSTSTDYALVSANCLFVTNCVFQRNVGVCLNEASGVLSKTVFEMNDGSCLALHSESGRIDVEDCLFSGNVGLSTVSAYSSYARTLDLNVSNCVFNGNASTINGAAINANQSYECTGWTVSDCLFTSNTAYSSSSSLYAGRGGAIAGGGVIRNCRFVGNLAANGGALYKPDEIHDCVFIDNSAITNTYDSSGRGGAIYGDVSIISRSSFVENLATREGGAVYSTSKSWVINESLFLRNIIDESYYLSKGWDVRNKGSAMYCSGTTYVISSSVVGNIGSDQNGGYKSYFRLLNSIVEGRGAGQEGCLDIAGNVIEPWSQKPVVKFWQTYDSNGYPKEEVMNVQGVDRIYLAPSKDGGLPGAGVLVWHDPTWENIAYSVSENGDKTAMRGDATLATEMLETDAIGQIIVAPATIGAVYRASSEQIFELVITQDGVLAGYTGMVPDGYELIIPDEVTAIAADAFANCGGLLSVTIPPSVTNIGAFAFSGCSGLKTATVSRRDYDLSVFPEGCQIVYVGGIDISNIEVFSGWPWKEVVIGYTIAGSADETMSLELTAKDNASGKTYACKTLEGVGLTPGRHVIKWNASVDGAKFKSDDVVLTARIVHKTTPPLYCVVDLSAGANATSYPVSYLDDVPVGGWTDEYKTTKLVLRRIEAGTFTMGSPSNEVGHEENEALHFVELTKPFYMGIFEVTQKQYQLVMGNNPSAYEGDARPVENISFDMIRGALEGKKWPLTNAVDATSFMGKIRARTGLTLDLPTEAQWEYACRAGTTTALNIGKVLVNPKTQDPGMDGVGRYGFNNGFKGGTKDGKGGYDDYHTTVGSYLPNAWGLYDMHGNVQEWCLDWYKSALGTSMATDPTGPANQYGSRVLRGGSWSSYARACRSAFRMMCYSSSFSNDFSGLRLCCSVGQEKNQVAEPFGTNGGTATMSSASIAVDTTFKDGTRVADRLAVAYGSVGAAGCRITANGTEIVNSTANGAMEWLPSAGGEYKLVYSCGGVTMESTVIAEELTVSAPVITPGDGSVFKTGTCKVTITCATDDVLIFYTKDGSVPKMKSEFLYRGPFEITNTATIVAVALGKNGIQSDYAKATISHVEPEPSALAVTALQCSPRNGLVDIIVTFQGAAEDVAKAECLFAATNGTTKAAIPVEHITRNGDDMGSGTVWTRKFIWDARADVGTVKIDDVALTVGVRAALPGVQLWEGGPYWAECNVGATKPEECGYYFWWGDTVGYKRNANNDGWISVKDSTSFSFSSGNCPTYGKSKSELVSAGYLDSAGNLVAAHDAATAHLGAPWRMPTDAEFSALIGNCTTTWTTRNGVRGLLVSGKGAYSLKSIFLPAAGYGCSGYLYNLGSFGLYWSTSPHSDGTNHAIYLYSSSSTVMQSGNLRSNGPTVRPVRMFDEVDILSDAMTTHFALDCRPLVVPTVEGDDGATVTGDDEMGYVVKPSEGNTAVEVTIPQGVDAAKVTVEVLPVTKTITTRGARVKIVSWGADITELLNMPAADGNGVIDLTKATVKEEIVKEAMDPKKGAVIDLCAGSQGTASPAITTAPTRVGLFYQLREGETLDGMVDGDSTVGDGEPWTPEIKVKGGKSAFYSIGVGKGE